MSAIGDSRRLQALSAVGWSHTQLSRIFVVSRGIISRAISGAVPYEDPFIAKLYPDLVNGPLKPSYHVMQSAKKAGFAPPEEWEGLDMDDPSVEHQRTRKVHPTLRGARLAEYVELRINGKGTAVEISEGAGYSDPERCAELLARACQAPLGRALLSRHQTELMLEAMAARLQGAGVSGVS